MQDYKRTLQIYGPKNTKHYISLLNNLYKIKILLQIKEASSKIVEDKEFQINALPMQHDTPSLAYSFEIKNKLRLDKKKIKKLKLPNSPLLKKLQQGKDIIYKDKKIKASQVTYKEQGRKIAFILDTAPNNNTIKLANKADLLICEASFTNQEKELAKERKHLTAKQAATIAKKAKVKQLILTHISQRYEHNTEPILQEAKKIFKNTKIVKDFDEIEL